MKKLIRVPCIDQTEQWPTGCESVSAVMLLHHLGVNISVDDFIRDCLTMQEFQLSDEGKMIGADPRKAFAGNPYDAESMGCYAPVIVEALRRALPEDKNWIIRDLTGVSMETLCHEYLDRNRPVVFWACLEMREPEEGPEWYLDDGESQFRWISNEHCMLLVGYDENHYYFNDPWQHRGTVGYARALTEARHAAQYAMAVTAYSEEEQTGCRLI
ncbi:MAG: C39 family peptidase [Oscillospiraceae bacterium]|nr:C39 family peptidase [Oscillospiraceae bacterium]